MDRHGETPRPELLTGAKKFQLGCLISFQLPMGFQNFIQSDMTFARLSKLTLHLKLRCILSPSEPSSHCDNNSIVSAMDNRSGGVNSSGYDADTAGSAG